MDLAQSLKVILSQDSVYGVKSSVKVFEIFLAIHLNQKATS